MQDPIGDRMKENYEDRFRFKLVRRMPVIIRLDGRAFHSFCRRFEKPYDPYLHEAFHCVATHLCKEISGTVLAEHHSDEISLLLLDYTSEGTEACFDYNIQKLVSVAASIASTEFCRALIGYGQLSAEDKRWPVFDGRAFNIPKEEVGNYFWWRNKDCVRNSISMVAQSHFSHKELDHKNVSEMQEMLFQVHGINWAKLPQEQKSGWWYERKTEMKPIEKGPKAGETVERSIWTVTPAPANLEEHQQRIAAIMAAGEPCPSM